jgi:soluble lytic murein transglycosylase-like protein
MKGKHLKNRRKIRLNPELQRVLVMAVMLILLLGAVFLKEIELKDYSRTEATDEHQAKIKPTVQPLEISPPTESAPEETPTIIYYDCPLSDDLQDYISKQCEENEIPMPLILAMIEVESSFKVDAISPTDDYGLMQINKINHEWLSEKYGIKDFLDPYQNVFCGITIISEHYKKYGDIDKALMAYNLGATGAKRLWDIGITKNAYTGRIRTAMETYEGDLK